MKRFKKVPKPIHMSLIYHNVRATTLLRWNVRSNAKDSANRACITLQIDIKSAANISSNTLFDRWYFYEPDLNFGWIKFWCITDLNAILNEKI